MAAEIAPRKIDENIGRRIRVIFGETTGDQWLLLLEKDNGDRKWQDIHWKGIPSKLAKQLNNCKKKGRKITSVDFFVHVNGYGNKKKPWYIEGVKDGAQTHRWWGYTDAPIENYNKNNGRKVQVSFGRDDYGNATHAILEGENDCSLSPFLHSDLKHFIAEKVERARIQFIRLFRFNQYFARTGDEISYSFNNTYLQEEIIKGNVGNISDVAVANDSQWIVIRPDYIVASGGVDNELTTKINQFYTEQREYNRKRSQEIIEYHNGKKRKAREGRERKKRETVERLARERAERERVEREAREATERAESLEAKIEKKLLEEVKHIQETEKRLKKRKRSVLDVMQEMSPARRSRISIGMEETNDTKSICVICQDRSAQRAVVPCGHLCLCDRCSAANMELCPLCRGRVESTIKIYMGN